MGEAMITRRGGGGLKIDGLLDEYVVSSGSISAGDFVKWVENTKLLNGNAASTSGTRYKAVAQVDASRVVIVWLQGNNSSYYYAAAVVTISNTSAIPGTTTRISDTFSKQSKGSMLLYSVGEGKYVFFDKNQTNTSYWYTARFSVNGTTINLTSKLAYNTTLSAQDSAEIRQIDANTYITCCIDAYSSCYVSVFTYSNGTYTYSKNGNVNSGLVSYQARDIGMMKLQASGKYAFLHWYPGNSAFYVTYATIGDTNVTVTAPQKLTNATLYPGGFGFCELSSNRYLVPCSYSSTSTKLYFGAVVITTDTSGITFGTKTQVSATEYSLNYNAQVPVAVFRRSCGRAGILRYIYPLTSTSSYNINYYGMTINGSTIALTTAETTVTKSSPQIPAVTNVNGKEVVLLEAAYQMGIYQIYDDVSKCNSDENVAGLATENGTANNTIKVYHPA